LSIQKPAIREVRIPKTAEVIAQRLRGQIVRGELTKGDSLPSETVLTEQFQISRPTLREAFRILESQRLIEIRRGARGGPRVLGPDPAVAATYAGLILQSGGTPLQDVYTARTIVEAPAIALMAEPPSEEQIAALRQNVKQYAELSLQLPYDADGLAELSEEFHRRVLELSGSPTLSLFSSMIRDIVHSVNTTFGQSKASADERRSTDEATVRAHGKLVDLLETGKLAQADKLWRRHLDEVDHVLRAGLPSAGTVLDILED
jgi:DNA-binding FadR family transcriptional regulator